MKLVQPIRDIQKIKQLKEELLKSSYRDFMIFNLGINIGLRISDMLKLKVKDVKNKSHISIKEQKTDKSKKIKINIIKNDLESYIEKQNLKNDDYLFQSRKGENSHISRIQAYRILNIAAKNISIGEIGTHTLRKTFGYHFYQKTKDVALLQSLFNHSSPSVTMRYIGINQDMIDFAMDNFSL